MRRGYFSAIMLVSLIHSSAIADAIYWTTGFGTTIERANLDGTGHEVVASTGNLSTGIALDTQARYAYWTGVQGRGISRASLDGSGTEFLLSPANDPEGIALDLDAGKMYWSESWPVPRIQRANLDGSDQETLIETGDLGPAGLALDVSAGYMYWTNPWEGGVYRANLDGTNASQLIETGISPIGIALDVVGGKIYWTENGGSNQSIRRADLDGSGIEDLVTTDQVALQNPLGIALDLGAGKIYWADYLARKIQRSNLDGSDVEDFLILAQSPQGIALDVVPEPATALLLALGGAGFLRRRR